MSIGVMLLPQLKGQLHLWGQLKIWAPGCRAIGIIAGIYLPRVRVVGTCWRSAVLSTWRSPFPILHSWCASMSVPAVGISTRPKVSSRAWGGGRVRDSGGNNDNDNCTEGAIWFFFFFSLCRELSPTRTFKWPECNRVQISYNTLGA